MQRRDALVAIGSGTAAALAGCLGAAQEDDPQQATQGNESDGDDGLQGTRLQVAGQGSVETDPNKAVVSLAVEATGDEAQAVRDQLSQDAEAVRQALLDAGLSDEQITTAFFSIREQHRGGGYEGVHAYEIELQDVDRVGEVVDVGVDAGADSVDRIHFTITDERREELRDQALEKAVEDARDEAETIAATQEMEIVGVERMSTQGSGVSPRVHRFEAAAGDAAAASTSIDQGPVTVSASVTVVYVIA